LGKHPALARALTLHPETAGLLASVADPERVAATLTAADDYAAIAALYVQYADPEDALSLTGALERNGEVICTLRKRNLLGSEAPFLFERAADAREADETYDQWARQALEAALGRSDEEVASLLNLLLKHGPEVRSRLRSRPGYRARFHDEVWPRLARAAAAQGNMFESYLEDARVWDLLERPESERLLRVWGLLAVDLLYGYAQLNRRAYPADLHDEVVAVLVHGDGRAVRALEKFRDEPLFFRFLRRPLSPGTRTAALDKLLQAGANYPDLLGHFNRLSETALAEEVGPPPEGPETYIPFYYTVYEVPRKLWQGRDPTTMDWVQAVADPAFLARDVFTGAGARP
jgi:hypothetical protein